MELTWPAHYFLPRNFELAQPLYDLAFLLQTAPEASGQGGSKYRAASLHSAACRLDGYSSHLYRWLTGDLNEQDFHGRPSSRIKTHLIELMDGGRLSELDRYEVESSQACLRLRSIRGLGNKMIQSFWAESPHISDPWLEKASRKTGLPTNHIRAVMLGTHFGQWQAAHVVPPLLRLLHAMETACQQHFKWRISELVDGLQPIMGPFTVQLITTAPINRRALKRAVAGCLFFRLEKQEDERWTLKHNLGWHFHLSWNRTANDGRSLMDLAVELDPLLDSLPKTWSDLHMHTTWSDGLASPLNMAMAAQENGLQYMAITDHSRSCKLQGGLNPAAWIKQSMALKKAGLPIPVLHGLEVDILPDGRLDAPPGILDGMDLVTASIHFGLDQSRDRNTARLIRAVESGRVDIIGHPTTQLLGKPGIPQFRRPPLDVNWDEVFEKCAQLKVALEINCFPARLDLSGDLLSRTIDAGCPVSLGSDAHAPSHLRLINMGTAILSPHPSANVLNHRTYRELKYWLAEARTFRLTGRTGGGHKNQSGQPCQENHAPFPITARIGAPRLIPAGSTVVGLDLTAGQQRKTGVARISGTRVETLSVGTDEEILAYVKATRPAVVGIDSPLGLPGGGDDIDPEAGIVRAAERELSTMGIPSYPALIDSMKNLTLRGIKLRREIKALTNPPSVIESYPGGTQDILSIPRKQKGLELLRAGLRDLGLQGPGLDTSSHDEMDAITSALVGRYFESGEYEALGIPAEAQLIMPKVRLMEMSPLPVIALTGKPGTGKSVVARYLAITYGFFWIKSAFSIKGLFPAQIMASSNPVVLDALHDPDDLNPADLPGRILFICNIDCPDSLIRKRLLKEKSHGNPSEHPKSWNDHSGKPPRRQPHIQIDNRATLEKLRWQIDDALFQIISLKRE